MTNECKNLEKREDRGRRDQEYAALLEVVDAIRAARTVQDFLWGEKDFSWGIEGWKRMFRKRVAKIDAVDGAAKHAAVELRKRLLQTAALSVAMMVLLGREDLDWEASVDLTGILDEHADPVT